MPSLPYVELHAHSAFSFLDGASLPEELVAAALELGHEQLALTDHDTLSGAMEHAQHAKALGLRARHGAEVSLADGHHLTLLVRDARGWRSLCRLLTLAHAHTRSASPDRRKVTPPQVSHEQVREHAEGLLCLSGCARAGVHDEAGLRALRDVFGPEGLRVELQRPLWRDDRARNRALEQRARRLGLRCVATGNVHAHVRERAYVQDAFVAIREHTTLDASEPLRRGNHAHVLASPRAMAARFADHPEAVAETLRVAELLDFDLTQDLGYRYPGAGDEAADRTLAGHCRAAFDARYPPGDGRRDEALGRLEEELRVIRHLDLSGFFVLHRDLLELAREVAVEVRGPSAARQTLPPGRGRGSSVSSIVCYLTGLSHVDPIENDLRLSRFLNEELVALPDIDLDFPRDVREVLIPRVHERYGRDRSALVAAFPTFRSRGAIRELGKALGLPSGEVERVARGAEQWSNAVGHDIATALGEGREREGRWAWLAWLAEQAHGLPRHLSQHSGGMIVATDPLVDLCPLVPAAMEGRQMVHWDKDSCADAGFLKIDLLGLGMLSAVERCVDLIARHRGQTIDLSRIPFDDPETFTAIQAAETTGVFQIESRAQMGSLRRTRPETLDDLTVQVAIVRPGPIQGGAVNPYIERRQRLREDPGYEVPYLHASLKEVLADTLGTIIFQDQVLEVAQAFAGFTPGEAEGLRRAMSRKRSVAAIRSHHRRFVEGAIERWGDVDEARAQAVWDMIVGFSGFGFPKAHGAAFGLLAYQSTWLRVHHPAEFLCALLDEQPMGFYPADALAHEAQRRGIAVLPPDVNASEVGCTLELPGGARGHLDGDDLPERRIVDASASSAEGDGAPAHAAPAEGGEAPRDDARARDDAQVRLGLGYVLGVRRDEVEVLVAERQANGPFASLGQLASRAGAGRPALEQLAWAGACDALAGGGKAARREALWALGVATPAVAVGGARRRGAQDGVGRGGVGGGADAGPASSHAAARRRAGAAAREMQLALPLDLPAAPRLDALAGWDAMVADYATTGVSLEHHPLALLRADLGRRGAVSTADLERLAHGTPVRIGGLVMARQRPGTAKGVAFLLLEDEHGTTNVVVPPNVYERDRTCVRAEPLIVAEGRLERFASAGGSINVVARRLRALEAPASDTSAVRDLRPAREGDEDTVAASAAAPCGVPDVSRGISPLDELALARARAEAAHEGLLGLEEEELARAAGANGGRGRRDPPRTGDFRAVAPPVLSFTQGRKR